MGEIEKHMPVLLEVVRELRMSPGLGVSALKVVIPAANERAHRAITAFVSRLSAPEASVEIRRGGAREILRQADAAVVASGTATLEAALAGCPTVLVYRVGWLFAFLARRFIKGVKHIGLANIIAEKAGATCPMPELLQENFTVDGVLKWLRPWLTDEKANEKARGELSKTMKLLQSDGDSITKIARNLV